MISERRFASKHNAFWTVVTPMCEHFTRKLNLQTTRFGYEVEAFSDSDHRALIAEVGFEIFAQHIENGVVNKTSLCEIDIEVLITRTRDMLYKHAGEPLSQQTLAKMDLQEANSIAQNLCSYFLDNHISPIFIKPQFKGCGILAACEGDIAFGNTLVEVKTVSRTLRVADIRQVLVYLALQYASSEPVCKTVTFINPRRGISVDIDVSEMSFEICGLDIYDLLDTVIKYISDLSPTLSGIA